jgi:putative hemolysin
VLGELVPKSIGLAHSERIALAVARPIDFLARLAGPLVRFLVWSTNLLARPFGGQPRRGMPIVTEEEIKTLVDAGEEGGVIEEEAKEMIYSIFEYGDTVAREVMVPRIDVASIPVDMPMLSALDIILKAGHSRIPVYNNSVDNVIGVLYAKDLLRYLRDGRTDVPLGKILRPAYFVPESKKVDELLGELLFFHVDPLHPPDDLPLVCLLARRDAALQQVPVAFAPLRCLPRTGGWACPA